jgi:hypothetical protein
MVTQHENSQNHQSNGEYAGEGSPFNIIHLLWLARVPKMQMLHVLQIS